MVARRCQAEQLHLNRRSSVYDQTGLQNLTRNRLTGRDPIDYP